MCECRIGASLVYQRTQPIFDEGGMELLLFSKLVVLVQYVTETSTMDT